MKEKVELIQGVLVLIASLYFVVELFWFVCLFARGTGWETAALNWKKKKKSKVLAEKYWIQGRKLTKTVRLDYQMID